MRAQSLSGSSSDVTASPEAGPSSPADRRPSPVLLDLLGDAQTQAHDLAKAEEAYRRAAELDPSEPSHQRGLGQTLLAEEKYPEALKVYEKLSDVMPDDSDVYLRIAQIYRELHQLDKAAQNLVKARQYAPGSGSDVQRGHAVPGAGAFRGCHTRIVGCGDGD